MPKLGQAFEPAHAEDATPWWRAVESAVVKSAPHVSAPETAVAPGNMPWPLD